jgi:hypothetical protein
VPNTIDAAAPLSAAANSSKAGIAL